jgi:hypothetical protein
MGTSVGAGYRGVFDSLARLPQRQFGANAAWFRLNVPPYDLLSALTRFT